MYFESRVQAGQMLAAELEPLYRYENCAVVALSDGGVVVGEQIAAHLHCVLTLLLVEDVEIPGEDLVIGSISQDGDFSYNSRLEQMERDEYDAEYHGYFEEKKREAFQRINRLLGDGGLINHEMLRNRVIILVSDGLETSSTLDSAVDFLKPIQIEKLVVAMPVVAVETIDDLHMKADELHILSVRENFVTTDHYFNQNEVPSHEDTIKKINQIVLNWR